MGRRSREKAERRRDAPSVAPSAASRTLAHVREPRVEGPLPIAPDPSGEVMPWSEVWRADGAAFTTIFVVALLFRIAVLVQTAGTPYYAYFLAIIFQVFGDGPWAPRFVQIILGSVTPVVVYAIGTRLFTRRVA